MTRPLRVGLCGLGTMGRNHLRALLERDDVTVVALADPQADVRDSLVARLPGSRVFADPLTMLREEALDALVVAVPTTLHKSVAAEALDGGVPCLVEKPLAANVDEARDLVDRAARTGTLVQVGHVERFNPAVEALAERLRGGALGRIYAIRAARRGPMPERIRDVGVAVDLATHDVDILCHLIGERPVRVYAELTRHVHTEHEDLLAGLLAFPSGAAGQIDVDWLSPRKQRRLTVVGEEGMFELDYLAQTLRFTRGARTAAPTYLDGYAPTFTGESEDVAVDTAEPLKRQLDAFLAAVRNGGPSPVTAEEGLWAVVLADALLRSAQGHAPVAIAPLEVA